MNGELDTQDTNLKASQSRKCLEKLVGHMAIQNHEMMLIQESRREYFYSKADLCHKLKLSDIYLLDLRLISLN